MCRDIVWQTSQIFAKIWWIQSLIHLCSLDGSRQAEERLEEGKPATTLSALDHYTSRPVTPQFEEMTLLHFVQHYSMPKNVGEEPVAKTKMVVVRVQPHCSPDTSGP